MVIKIEQPEVVKYLQLENTFVLQILTKDKDIFEIYDLETEKLIFKNESKTY